MNTTDNQWLIKSGIGKQGTNANGNNIYPVANQISNTFFLRMIKHPVRQWPTPGAANSIFAIFSDLSYYNERYPYSTPVYFCEYPIHDQNLLSNDKHNLTAIDINNQPKNIKHLYLTNIYEGDDPPDLVQVNPGNNPSFGTPYSFSPSTRAELQHANHSVAPGKDITIIISHQNIKNAFPGVINCSFFFNEIKPVSGNSSQLNPQFISLSPIDSDPGIISSGSFTIVDPARQIDLNISNGYYTYINLRATSNIGNPFPQPPLPSPDYYNHFAVFTLKNSNTQAELNKLNEPIRLIN